MRFWLVTMYQLIQTISEVFLNLNNTIVIKHLGRISDEDWNWAYYITKCYWKSQNKSGTQDWNTFFIPLLLFLSPSPRLFRVQIRWSLPKVRRQEDLWRLSMGREYWLRGALRLKSRPERHTDCIGYNYFHFIIMPKFINDDTTRSYSGKRTTSDEFQQKSYLNLSRSSQNRTSRSRMLQESQLQYRLQHS